MSHTDVLISVVGRDRPGIVESVTRSMVGQRGNVLESRLAKLGGEFAGFFLVRLDEGRVEALDQALAADSDGLDIRVRVLESDSDSPHGGVPYRLVVSGADHEGIIHDFGALLARSGVNIANMRTVVKPSPITGTPLFSMRATLEVPLTVPLKVLRADLEAICEAEAVEAELNIITGS